MSKRVERARADHGQSSPQSLVGKPRVSEWRLHTPRLSGALSSSPGSARLEASDTAFLKQASDDLLGRDKVRVAKDRADRTDVENCRLLASDRLLKVATVQELNDTGLSSCELFRK